MTPMGEPSKQSERDLLLALIPLEAKRIKVLTDKGHEKWRAIDPSTGDLDQILPSDEILVNAGKPVTMLKAPGRRKKTPIIKPPTATVAVLQEHKKKFLDSDPLVLQLDENADDDKTLQLIMRGLAQEQSSLEFERVEAERTGKDTSQLSLRRVNALKALSDTWIKRKDLMTGNTVDMASTAFSRLFQFMLSTFREAMLDGNVPTDQVEAVFSCLTDRLTDETWEQEAENHMKGG